MLRKLCSALALCTVSVSAFAGGGYYQTVEVPRQECWTEQVPVSSGVNYGGAALGGLAGGILGNQVGGGSGRVAATAVGAVAGAMVGNHLAGAAGPRYQAVQRCKTVVDYQRVPVPERVVYVGAPARERVVVVDRDGPKHHWKHAHHDRGHHYGWRD